MNFRHILFNWKGDDEKKLIFAFSYFISFDIIDNLVNQLANIEIWDSLVTKGILYLSMIFALPVVAKRLKPVMLVLPAIYFFMWGYSYLFYDENRIFLTDNNMVIFWVNMIPTVLIVSTISNWERLYSALRTSSIIVICCALVYLPTVVANKMDADYMNYSYQIMFSIVFMVFLSFDKRNLFDIFIALIGIFCVVANGARGTIIGIMIGLIIFILSSRRFRFNYNLMISLTAFVIISFFSEFIAIFEKVYSYFGISSRTLSYLNQDIIFESSGRDVFAIESMSVLSDNLFDGVGMFGDRVFLKGFYSHNVLIEIMVNYGIVLGGVIICTIIWYMLTVIQSPNKDHLNFICLVTICSSGFMKLMLSSSYNMEPMFFVMIVLCIKARSRTLTYNSTTALENGK